MLDAHRPPASSTLWEDGLVQSSGFPIFISSRIACLWFLFTLREGYNSDLSHVTCYYLFFVIDSDFILFLWTGDKHFIFQAAQNNWCYELPCSFHELLSFPVSVFLSLRISVVVLWLLCDDRSSAHCTRFSPVWWNCLVIRSVVSVYPGLWAVSGPVRPELMCLPWLYLLCTEKQWLKRGIASGTAACG